MILLIVSRYWNDRLSPGYEGKHFSPSEFIIGP